MDPVGDVNGDKRADLFVYNGNDWGVVVAIEGVREEHVEAPALEQLKRLFPSSFGTSQ